MKYNVPNNYTPSYLTICVQYPVVCCSPCMIGTDVSFTDGTDTSTLDGDASCTVGITNCIDASPVIRGYTSLVMIACFGTCGTEQYKID